MNDYGEFVDDVESLIKRVEDVNGVRSVEVDDYNVDKAIFQFRVFLHGTSLENGFFDLDVGLSKMNKRISNVFRRLKSDGVVFEVAHKYSPSLVKERDDEGRMVSVGGYDKDYFIVLVFLEDPEHL